jgi:serine O-acetyltransferase
MSSPENSSSFKLVYLFHAGFQTLFFYRTARLCYKKGFVFLARAFTAFARFMTSCDLHYKAELEGGVLIPHGRGVVIGEGVKIAKRCAIFQHTSLGAFEGKGGYPSLEEGVNIYPGSVVAGDVNIGEYSRVGPNVYLTVSVPKHTRVSPPKPHIVLYSHE